MALLALRVEQVLVCFRFAVSARSCTTAVLMDSGFLATRDGYELRRPSGGNGIGDYGITRTSSAWVRVLRWIAYFQICILCFVVTHSSLSLIVADLTIEIYHSRAQLSRASSHGSSGKVVYLA